jgi:hypothetical protein
MSVVDRSFDHPLKLEEEASIPLAGGIVNQGYQCGMLWGAALAAGAQAYRLLGSGPQAETGAIIAAQSLVESFRARNKHIDCLELTEANLTKKTGIIKLFIKKGGPIGCVLMTARYAPDAFSAINTTLSEKHIEAPSPPVSCSALLAEKMGESEMHTVMAAGLAGGIGLSGGACGALGAAIWIIGMNGSKEQAGRKVINSRIADTIDRFIRSKSADFRFECSEIVGRRFENVGDHAGYLRDGGCSEIIELLATK